MRKIGLGLFFIFFTAISVSAQNRFEGYNIIVDAPDTQMQPAGAFATRYVPTTTQITITDLNTTTPMKLQSCGGNFTAVRQTNASTASITANNVDYKWCFTGEDKIYRITFQGDRYTSKLTYNWIAIPDESSLGFYNVRDFGAKGDGRTDDTLAIRSAVAFVASRNGGRLQFPEGDYVVGNSPEYPNFKGITLPSGIIIEGTGSNSTDSPIGNVVKRNASRITLQGQNRAVFRIGEGTERVIVRDIELYAQNDQNTYGIEAVGAFASSQEAFFERVTFTNFFRGIYAHALPANNMQWQFDFVKVNECRFAMNRDAGIFIDFWNSNWAVKSSFFVMPQIRAGVAANGIRIIHNGNLLLEDTFAGAPPGAKGGDFVNADEMAQLTVIGSQCEKMTRSIVFGDVPGAGNLGYSITLINNVFDDPVEIKGRKTVVSIGNLYGANSIRLHPDARIYSTGDRFCYDGNIVGCATGAGATNFQGGKLIFSTGQPAEGSVPGRPTVFGHDVQFNAPVQLPNLQLNALPTQSVGNGSFVYCTNCRRNSAPCQSGGNGAPAMFVAGRWECL